MLINLTEIRDDHTFENFCMELLEYMDFKISVPPAIGPDSGRDIICEEPVRYARQGFRWLVSCKHYARSKNSVGVNDDEAKPHKLTEHACDGFMFFFSTGYTESFRTSVENICHQIRRPYKIFNALEIEKVLLSSPAFYPLIRRYLPNSHDLLVTLKSSEPCCPYQTPQDALYAVYTQDDPSGKVSFCVVGDCCIGNYIEQFQEHRVAYGVSQIRSALY